MFGMSIWEMFLVILIGVGPWVFFGGLVFALWRRMTMIADGQTRTAEAIRRMFDRIRRKSRESRREPNP